MTKYDRSLTEDISEVSDLNDPFFLIDGIIEYCDK